MQQQRRFVRLKTRQPARILFSGDRVTDCEICDFSSQGFFLTGQGQAEFELLAHAQSGARVEVEFVAGPRALTYRVEGRIAHASERGLGVYVEAMADAAFQALLEFRANLYKGGAEIPRDLLDPVDAQTIRSQCLSLFRPFLVRVIREFLELANEHAAEEYRPGGGLLEQSPYSRGLVLIKLNQDLIQQKFIEFALSKAQEVATPDASTRASAVEPELSLVEEEEFEDWLNVASVINKLEAALRRHLGYFERLYGLLSVRSKGEGQATALAPASLGQHSPFSPDPLCRAFQAVLAEILPGKAQRTPFYLVFGEAVARHGSAFYEQLGRLVEVVERRQGRQAGSRRASDTEILDGPTLPDLIVPRTAVIAEVAPPEAMGYSLDRTLAALHEAGLVSPKDEARAKPEPGRAASVEDLAAAESRLIRTTGYLQQIVSQLAQRLPETAGPDLPSPLPARPGATMASSSEILLALDGLLQTRRVAHDVDQPHSLTEQLQLRLAKAGGAEIFISPQQQQMLDSLSGLYDRLMQEYVPASEIEGLMKRFEAPFFKLALKDPDFLASDSHPARQVINVLDQFAIAADDAGKFFDPKLPQVLGVLVDNIIAKADHETDVYEKAVHTLDKMLQPLRKVRKQRIHRLQETSEGKHRILLSRIRVLNELETRLGGRQVPRILLRLLDSGWRHYLSLLELRQGMQGAEWETGIGAVERLQVWLDPGFTAEAGYPAEVAQLMRQLSQGMATVCIEPSQLNCLLEELDGILLGRLDADRQEVEHVHLEPGRILRGYEDETMDFPRDSKLREQLVLGSWWDIVVEGGKPTPMQLVWLSQPSGSCAFANRSATKKHEFSIAELARMKEGGRAALATDKELPILERSESALVDAVYRHLSHQTTHDPVTDLINRKALLQQLGLMAAMPVCEGQVHSLCVLEFDQLRVIAHQHGQEAKEALLRQLAAEVQQRLRPDDVLAALGEDSFAAYLPVCDAAEGRRILAEVIAWLKGYRFQRVGDSFSVGANVGLAEFTPGSQGAEEILRRADAACLRAKSMGRNQIQVYTAEDAGVKGQEDLMEWAGRIDRILDRGGLYLRCQLVSPIGNAADLKPYYEILLGVRDPDGAEVGPQPFIQAVERWNRVHDIDIWVVDSTFQWIRAHQDAFAAIGGFSINLSAQSLNNEEVLAFLHQELSRQDIPVEKIMFEITETGTINSYAAAQEFIQQIRRYGCKFCIDDFGSGFASYGHLKNLHTDTLKIDGIFIKDMLDNPADLAMVKSMQEIGHSLGMHVVAEFVATPEILAAVREIGVDYAQGYALHKPMPVSALLETLAAADGPGASGAG